MVRCPAPLEALLDDLVARASTATQPLIADSQIAGWADYVATCPENRAAVRLLIACLLAKLENPEADVRKPYTEIAGVGTFSGRRYDEGCVARLLHQHDLPINTTTAFLTPALRNHNQPLTLDRVPVGRPRQVYVATLELLEAVQSGRLSAENLLLEVIRILVVLREARQHSLSQRLATLRDNTTKLQLSAEGIVKLIGEHMQFKNSARLPVLVVAAAYTTAAPGLGKQIRLLLSHNAADISSTVIARTSLMRIKNYCSLNPIVQ